MHNPVGDLLPILSPRYGKGGAQPYFKYLLNDFIIKGYNNKI